MPAASLRLAALAATAVLALGSTGCGEGSEDAEPQAPAGAAPPPTAFARLALPAGAEHLDPLFARTWTERMVSRQIYDPLIDDFEPPLGLTGSREGPLMALREEPSGGWTLGVRSGGQFADGAPLDAAAVVANSRRWFASGLVERVVPELIAVRATVAGEVGFQLTRPVPDLPAKLSDPRFSLVSPAALPADPRREVRGGAGGSGAYEPAAASGESIELAANPNWWGSGAGLGPGVERLNLLLQNDPSERLELLRDGVVDIAYELEPIAAPAIAGDPLLISSRQGGRLTAASAAVRGLGAGSRVQPLSEIWLTTLRAAG